MCTTASAMNFTENQQACTVMEKLLSQRRSGKFCDVVFHIEGQTFLAHRNVLAACSSYFDSALKTHKSIKEHLIVVCQNLDAFQLLLNYMYTGIVVIDKNNVAELLQLAHNFLIVNVKNYCAEYLDHYLDLSNCLTVNKMAKNYNLTGLQESACMFINNHIIEILEQNEILEFTLNELEAFFKEKQHLIPQHVLLNFLGRWIDHDLSKRESDFPTLLTFINWESIEHSYLKDYLKYSSFCRNNPKCAYLLLSCLEENDVDLPEFRNLYAALQYHSFMNTSIFKAIRGFQKALLPLDTEENNALVTVSQLVKATQNSNASPTKVSEKVPLKNKCSNSRRKDTNNCRYSNVDYNKSANSEQKSVTRIPRTNRRKGILPKLKPQSSVEKTKEEKLENQRERKRKWLAKIKSNPELLAKMRKKEAERRKRRKLEHKITSIREKKPSERKIIRKSWRESKQRQRARLKEQKLNHIENSLGTSTEIPIQTLSQKQILTQIVKRESSNDFKIEKN